MSAASDLDRTLVRQHRIARLAKGLLATAPLYDAGLPMEHRPFDHEGCQDLALALVFVSHSTGGDHAATATLHQLAPEALHAAAPGFIIDAWRRLVTAGPSAESRWHQELRAQLRYIAESLPPALRPGDTP